MAQGFISPVKESGPYPEDNGGAIGASAVSGIITCALKTCSGYGAENGWMNVVVGNTI